MLALQIDAVQVEHHRLLRLGQLLQLLGELITRSLELRGRLALGLRVARAQLERRAGRRVVVSASLAPSEVDRG